jgi:GT2 family glycosyltransferase
MAARCARSDLAQVVPGHADSGANAGLVAYVEMDVDDTIDSGELLLTARSGELAKISFAIERPSGSIRAQTDVFLRHLDLDSLATADLLDRHVGPALHALWAQRSRTRPQEQVHDFGAQPDHPVCSVIIPLFGRCDLLMFQLSQLCRDSELAQSEIIYVVDDPGLADETLCLAAEVAHLFPLPFRVVDARANLGYAGANNLGAGIARGDYLLLLNSDILPDRPGWLGRLCDKHSSLSNAGAIAPRLLYEDGSIQHDGMRFAPHPKFPSLRINEHAGKGLPVRLAPPAEDVAVPAVTAACMLLPRRLFSEVGGLDEEFILGDFEDSDLCLKLRERGLQSYVIRSETLFHLERLSQNLVSDLAWRQKLTLYNCWRQTQRWGSSLSEE